MKFGESFNIKDILKDTNVIEYFYEDAGIDFPYKWRFYNCTTFNDTSESIHNIIYKLLQHSSCKYIYTIEHSESEGIIIFTTNDKPSSVRGKISAWRMKAAKEVE